MNTHKSRRSTVERRKEILRLLSRMGQVQVHQLSKIFHVSEVTIRNDLDLFESKGLLVRSRGGARNTNHALCLDFQLKGKEAGVSLQKARIGRKAAGLIKEGETIILDSGTTTLEIARNLRPRGMVTIITNAFHIIDELLTHAHVHIIIPGGLFRRNSHSLVGPLAEKSFRNMYVDKVFLGVDGFDIDQGVYAPTIYEASLNQVMIEAAKEVIAVLDSSKFNHRSLALICPTKKISRVVTDSNLSKENQIRLRDAKVEVVMV